MSTEGILSLWRGNSVSLHPCLILTPISLCFTGFKLVFAYCYIILCLSLFISSPVPSPSPSSPSPFFLIPSSLCLNSHIYASPRQSSALSITSHKRNKSKTHKPASTYTWLLKRTRVNGTCPSILEEENRNPSNQPNKQTKNSTKKECILSFYILVYKPSIFSEMISFFLKKIWRKIAIYTRSLAQGVKFTDFFNEKNTQKKLPQVFFTSAPCSCVSLRDFVKLIVGAFFYFFNKNELEKKISTASLEKVTVQVCNNCSELSSASQEPIWPSFGQTLKMLNKKKNDKEKQREKILEMSWISVGYVPLGLFALKDEHVLVYVNKTFYHQTAMPVSSTANSVLWQKQKLTKKKYIQLTRKK